MKVEAPNLIAALARVPSGAWSTQGLVARGRPTRLPAVARAKIDQSAELGAGTFNRETGTMMTHTNGEPLHE